MFPIAALDGQVIGFGGRALGDEKGAKYINTPETPLYKKSQGALRARPRARGDPQDPRGGAGRGLLRRDRAAPGRASRTRWRSAARRSRRSTWSSSRAATAARSPSSSTATRPGLAAPAKAAQALFPAGMARQGGGPAVRGGARSIPTTTPGPAAAPGSRRCSPPPSRSPSSSSTGRSSGPAPARPREAALEQKLAAVARARAARAAGAGGARALRLRGRRGPPARARPRGAARRSSPPTAAGPPRRPRRPRRGAPAPARAPAPHPRPAGPPVASGSLLPGPAADALGLLAAFPELGPVAEEEGLPQLLPQGPLADAGPGPHPGAVRDRGGARAGRECADEATVAAHPGAGGPGPPGPAGGGARAPQGRREGVHRGGAAGARAAPRAGREARARRCRRTSGSPRRSRPAAARIWSGGSARWRSPDESRVAKHSRISCPGSPARKPLHRTIEQPSRRRSEAR